MVSMHLGKPGIFDTYANTLQTQELQRRHGIDAEMGQFDFAGHADASRSPGLAGQLDAMGMYRQGALGQAPSAAQMAWQQQAQQNATNALGLAARGRGGNIAGQMGQAMAGNAYANQQTNQGMAQLRAQEQQAAQAGYAGMANQLYGQGFGYDQLAQQSRAQAADNTLGWYSAERGMDLQQDAFQHQRQMDRFNMGMSAAKTVAGAVGGAMGGGMMSDERSKDGLRPTTLAASQAVGDITPTMYQYKPGMGPAGQRIGPTAQDLQANPLTASLVQEGQDGMKRVDIGGMAALSLAANAEQEGRIRALEQSAQPTSTQGSTITQQALRMAGNTATPYVPSEERTMVSDKRAKTGMASTLPGGGRGGHRGGMRGGGY